MSEDTSAPANDDGAEATAESIGAGTNQAPGKPPSRLKALLGKIVHWRWAQMGVGIFVGVMLFAALVSNREPPERQPPEELGTPVRTFEVAPLTVTPRAVGYGVVRARREWQMVAQVSGRVEEMYDGLRVGAVVPEGTELLRIDPSDYALAANRQAAGVESSRAQLAQLQAQEQSLQANLQIEQRSLELVRRDLERTRELFTKGNAPRSDLDAAERAVLAQEKSVQSIKNSLSELPANRRVLQAQISETRAGLQGARLEVGRTQIVSPFDMRFSEVHVQARDVVSAGQVLAKAHGIDAVEVNAQLPLAAVRSLVRFNASASGQPVTAELWAKLPELVALEALIRVKIGEEEGTRKAKIDRFTAVDPKTRTMGIVAVVEKPYEVTKKGEASLITGMYVEVDLRGAPQPGCLAIPRASLHDHQVYLVNGESRLQKRDVKVGMRQARYVCIEDGLQPGERVIATNVTPAIDGMLLKPKADGITTRRLALQARGEDEQ